MKNYQAIIEKCNQTGLFVGYVPGFPGAHSQGETIEELKKNLIEVISMLLEDGEPKMDSEYVCTENLILS
jgi:predicted RNase H-like HicB family nuclease